MARSKAGGTRSRIRGTVGRDYYYSRQNLKGETQQIVSNNPEVRQDARSRAQIINRMVMATVGNIAKHLKPIISSSFDTPFGSIGSYSRFKAVAFQSIKADAVGDSPKFIYQDSANSINCAADVAISEGQVFPEVDVLRLAEFQSTPFAQNVGMVLHFDPYAADFLDETQSELTRLAMYQMLFGQDLDGSVTLVAINLFYPDTFKMARYDYVRLTPIIDSQLNEPIQSGAGLNTLFKMQGNARLAGGVYQLSDDSEWRMPFLVLAPLFQGDPYPTGDACLVFSRRYKSGWIHNSAWLKVASLGLASNFESALATFKIGNGKFLNGGDNMPVSPEVIVPEEILHIISVIDPDGGDHFLCFDYGGFQTGSSMTFNLSGTPQQKKYWLVATLVEPSFDEIRDFTDDCQYFPFESNSIVNQVSYENYNGFVKFFLLNSDGDVEFVYACTFLGYKSTIPYQILFAGALPNMGAQKSLYLSGWVNIRTQYFYSQSSGRFGVRYANLMPTYEEDGGFSFPWISGWQNSGTGASRNLGLPQSWGYSGKPAYLQLYSQDGVFGYIGPINPFGDPRSYAIEIYFNDYLVDNSEYVELEDWSSVTIRCELDSSYDQSNMELCFYNSATAWRYRAWAGNPTASFGKIKDGWSTQTSFFKNKSAGSLILFNADGGVIWNCNIQK